MLNAFQFFYKNRVFPNDMKKYQILLLTARNIGMQWEIQRTPHIYQILLGCTVYNVHSFTFWIQVMNWWINILLYVSIVIRGCQIVGLFQSSLNFENFIDQLVEMIDRTSQYIFLKASYFTKLHCYKEYPPLQCLGTKQHRFWTLAAL